MLFDRATAFLTDELKTKQQKILRDLAILTTTQITLFLFVFYVTLFHKDLPLITNISLIYYIVPLSFLFMSMIMVNKYFKAAGAIFKSIYILVNLYLLAFGVLIMVASLYMHNIIAPITGTIYIMTHTLVYILPIIIYILVTFNRLIMLTKNTKN